jgi:peptidyl-prolyl cis-trans isomerase A (cyclophilin A)
VNSRFQIVAAFLLLVALSRPQPPVHVVVTTDLGEIEMEIHTERAPATATNFLKYVDAGLYDGGLFHRTVRPDNQREKPVKIAVIQGAANTTRNKEFFPPIALERTNQTGLLHKDGTVSMARDAVDSATDEFFICVGDQPELDFGGKRNRDGQGFAAFGRVVRGMDVVRRIQQSAADGERLRPPIRIISARRLSERL